MQIPPISLPSIRDILLRLEDAIIFGLILRSRLGCNSRIYERDLNPSLINGRSTPVLDFYIRKVEVVNSLISTYNGNDLVPFFSNHSISVVTFNSDGPELYLNNVNLNEDLLRKYKNVTVGEYCHMSNGRENETLYSQSIQHDYQVLQVISQRIHTGKYVAEAKYQNMTLQPDIIKAIMAKNETRLNELITDNVQEDTVRARIRSKAELYSRQISTTTIQSACNGTTPSDIGDNLVPSTYDYVIDLTKKVEIAYLLNRLS